MKYKLFGKSGLKVSELCLGTMTFGTEWGWGCDEKSSREIFDAFVEAGGNFIDTANRYTDGTSEKFLGKFIKDDRDRYVIATKYTLFDRMGDVSFSGNSRKNMFRSVEDSLRRMQTDYIDLLWVHAWDFTSPVEEVMRGLDDLVRMGKVHYIGISDTPAWVVARANALASERGWAQFTGLQIEYSLIERTPERELIPMAGSFGMAVTPWGPLGGGVLTGKYLENEEGRIEEDNQRRNSRNTAIARKVVEIAGKINATPGQVALKWIMQRDKNYIPIVGATKASQLKDSLGSLNVDIPIDLIQELDGVSEVELGFPHDFLKNKRIRNIIYGGTYDDMVF